MLFDNPVRTGHLRHDVRYHLSQFHGLDDFGEFAEVHEGLEEIERRKDAQGEEAVVGVRLDFLLRRVQREAAEIAHQNRKRCPQVL